MLKKPERAKRPCIKDHKEKSSHLLLFILPMIEAFCIHRILFSKASSLVNQHRLHIYKLFRIYITSKGANYEHFRPPKSMLCILMLMRSLGNYHAQVRMQEILKLVVKVIICSAMANGKRMRLRRSRFFIIESTLCCLQVKSSQPHTLGLYTIYKT